MTHLSLMAQGLRRRRRFYLRWGNKISWKNTHDLGAAAQATCPPWASLSSILLAVFVLHSNSAAAQTPPNPPSITHHWRFFAKEIYEGHNKIVGTWDCPAGGCMTKVEIPLHLESVSTTSTPVLCFPHRNIGDCLEEVSKFGGCKYWKCQTETPGEKDSMFANLNTHFQLSIDDPWNEEWRMGIYGAIYPDMYAKYPVADLHIIRQLVPTPIPVTKRPVNSLQQTTQTQEEAQADFSWLLYIQYTAYLLSLTTRQNVSQCFFCTSPSRPLLAAVPSNVWFGEPHGPIPTGKLENIPLFGQSLPVCLIGPSSRSRPTCSRNITVTKPMCVRPPALLWCNNNITSPCVHPPLQGFCTPVIIVPQVYLYEHKELASQLGGDRKKRELFIPLLIGLGLNVSSGAPGAAGAAHVQTHRLAIDFPDTFDKAMASTIGDSLKSFQQHIISQTGVVPQNRRRRDVVAAKQGEACLFLGEKCCFYVNESGLVEQNIRKLKELRRELQADGLTSWYSGPLVVWLVSFLVSTLVLGTLLTVCLIKFQKKTEK
ncbi:ERV-BabFcenv provirus ancestral Env polyprotein-like [Acomys russatus]|uniref:ERV-BabFcenv provirus ancestral Env polyprotein-like n=1 Tax=Acomys russatus TaxID=60746 RepID=UPI0021E1E38E|nr:ERV-BabFcenv provirus ancestral Env polyprotein-like [Acomys russatus]